MASFETLRVPLGVFSAVSATLIKLAYRPWVRIHAVVDFGLAACGPSFFYAFGALLLFDRLADRLPESRRKARRYVSGIFAGMLAYEFSQAFLTDRTFDWADIVATLIGGGLALLFLRRAPMRDSRHLASIGQLPSP